MDKIKVNNQVVSMRKFVKQAKTHVINKCTKHIKILEKRKGNEEQMCKTKRKIQRLLEEVSILKKIKPDTVSKSVLSKAKDWTAVLAKKNIPLEERCFAMLANHPPVQQAVEKFHNDNSDLIDKIPELVKEWEGKKSRSSQICKKNQKGKPNISNDPNTLPIGKRNNFPKPSEAQIKRPSTEPVESPSDSFNLKSIDDIVAKQNLANEKASKEECSANLDPTNVLTGPPEELLLNADDLKSDTDNDSLSNCSDLVQQKNEQINEKLPLKNQTKGNQSEKNPKQFKKFVNKNETSLAKKKMLPKKELGNCGKSDEKSVELKEEKSEKSDIRSKLLEISMSKTKVQNKPKHKTSTVYQQSETDSDTETSADAVKNLNVNSANTKHSISKKAEAKNKIKAVTMLDLNELQDVDEIPIDKSDSEDEEETDEDSGSQKKDSFFLRDGEPISESEDENTANEPAKKQDFPPFRKKPYGSFRDQRDNSFQKRRFDKHSPNGRNGNFRENTFMKNKRELSFRDNKQNFKRTFDDNADLKQNKKSKFSTKDKFRNRNESNKFTKNPKEKYFSQNRNQDAKRNGFPPKPSQSNSLKTNKADDKPLHPSWEAKRKLKEAASLKFQGKRIVFND